MKTKLISKTFSVTFLLFLSACCFAQTSFDGNALAYFLGKSATGTEIKDLKTNYHCEMANEAHYLSKDGIELILLKGLLCEIHLYNSSAVYGKFTGKLPNSLKFGMSSSEVKHLLGKPVVSYNNGYCEFELQNYILSCWLDGGKLNQVGVATKSAL